MFTPAQRIITSVRAMLPRVVTSGVVIAGEPILYCEPQSVPTLMTFLRDHSGTRCKQLSSITGVDVPSRDKRFEVCTQTRALHQRPVALCLPSQRPRLGRFRCPPPCPQPSYLRPQTRCANQLPAWHHAVHVHPHSVHFHPHAVHFHPHAVHCHPHPHPQTAPTSCTTDRGANTPSRAALRPWKLHRACSTSHPFFRLCTS